MTVALVTDSNAMLPAPLRDRFGITVVPLTIVLDDVAHPEDELDPILFCQRLRAGSRASTSAPSPGELLAAYATAADGGATAILSVHVGSNQSATVGAARLAAADAPVPVTVVDTGTASFIEGCCVWRAAEVLADGGELAEAEAAALAVAASAASVFTIGEIRRAADGGRLHVDDTAGVPVFSSQGPDMAQRGTVASVDEAARLLADLVAEHPGRLRVGVGDADAEEPALALLAALSELPNVAELVRYTVGPSVATHTGAGTVGAVFHPLP
jgi:fatty acid-binding protein DegV